ncbi:hemerythrin domain-containing protein [Geodermatophilus sp. SYSU D00815]
MSTTRTSATQLNLTGQAHVANGPLDMSAMYVMHHAFRRDLERFPTAVRRTPLDDRATWQSLARRWERFGMVLHHHHSIEDRTLWPPLLARIDGQGAAADRATLEAMQAEHETIDPQLAACAAGFAAMAQQPREEVREELARDLATIRDTLHRHLSHEETDALPLVQRHLPEADWLASEEAAKKSFAPRDLAFLIPWAADGLDRTARERAFGTAGLLFRVLYRLTRGRFGRAEAATFRYA